MCECHGGWKCLAHFDPFGQFDNLVDLWRAWRAQPAPVIVFPNGGPS